MVHMTSAPLKPSYKKYRDVPLVRGVWKRVHVLNIGKEARWDLEVELRIPKGVYFEFQYGRIGWGTEATGPLSVDNTGHCEWMPFDRVHSQCPGIHNIRGGGPLAWMVRADQDCVLPLLVAEWRPDDDYTP